MAATQPTGTVSLLFSDIEGSTQLLAAVGVERYEAALHDHLQATAPSRALKPAGARGWFWHARSHFTEGRAQRSRRPCSTATSARDTSRITSSRTADGGAGRTA